jgi:hypothetical protein
VTFRAAHHTHAAATVVATATGLLVLFFAGGPQARRTVEGVHAWASLPMLPLAVALLFTLGRRFGRLRGPAGALRFDALLTRVLFLVGVALLATGTLLLPEAALGPTARITLRQLHHALTEVFVPLLAAHVGLVARRRWAGSPARS